MRQCSLLLLVILACLQTGCGGGPRQASVPYPVAGGWFSPMTIRIDKTWDLVRTRVEGVHPAVTDLLEVTVLEPPPAEPGRPVVRAGDTLVLPYDRFARDAPPPSRGEELTCTAAEFVRPDPRGPRPPSRFRH